MLLFLCLAIATFFVILACVALEFTPDVITIDSGMPGPNICFVGGTHGNEPAGSFAIESMKWSPKCGKLFLIPRVNTFGLNHNSRYSLSFYPDVNRNYINGGYGHIAKKVMDIVDKCDLIIDFHEAWGYYNEESASIGSTLSPTPDSKATLIAEEAKKELNKNITETMKEFTVLYNRSCEIYGTLACYCKSKKKSYVLVELSGQNDIQPLKTRVNQAKTIINVALHATICDI